MEKVVFIIKNGLAVLFMLYFDLSPSQTFYYDKGILMFVLDIDLIKSSLNFKIFLYTIKLIT